KGRVGGVAGIVEMGEDVGEAVDPGDRREVDRIVGAAGGEVGDRRRASCAKDEGVIARAADENIGAGPAGQSVVAVATHEVVVTGAAGDQIVAAVTVDRGAASVVG